MDGVADGVRLAVTDELVEDDPKTEFVLIVEGACEEAWTLCATPEVADVSGACAGDGAFTGADEPPDTWMCGE